MREPAEQEVRKDVVLRKCFECLTEKGIEAVTIKDFSEATGMASSSIYYWFEDKDEIVLDAVKWGLDDNVKALFDYAFNHTDDLEKACEGIKKLAQQKKTHFRLVFQVTTSPQYGERIRKYSEKLDSCYQEYTEILSKKLNINFDELYPFVKLFISVLIDCIIWDSWDEFELETKYMLKIIKNQTQDLEVCDSERGCE